MKNISVLLVGGYGVVGQQVAQILNQYRPDLQLVIAGRDINKAKKASKNLKNSRGLSFDVENPYLPDELKIDIVLALVNDPQDKLLHFAHQNNIAYVDITRWTERLQVALSKATIMQNQKRSTMVFASSWMASIVATLINDISKSFSSIDSIDMSVLYALNDKAGPNSIDYMDRLTIPFTVKQNGKYQKILPFSDERTVLFSDGNSHKVFRIDMPEQFIFPIITNAQTVATRIGFDDPKSNQLLAFLVKKGIWKLLSGKRATGFRRKILYNPGEGHQHQIRTDIQGVDKKGHRKCVCLQINDPKGQTHLTATGAAALLIQLAEHIQNNHSTILNTGERFLDVEKLKSLLSSENVNFSINNNIE
ncbi:saccharopine dehydrogenase family protein [Xenorhabdus lircayensis]|uniref:Saccharopine dehydrogenase NADP-binding domain-containing protein n=1 Tax=Xenorhabdus lircayensis TaxID=2763499 RepID=A0ABS0U5P4_9GAMM|nr:saccharopine dehydrogenase NADP-binding domain-containing protein [Xenorhabdus lircayensis]MBI6548121.1 saccharopine dehydrogenase NADP-binding domain-containing protein [Xenorhabdus lircayensis]